MRPSRQRLATSMVALVLALALAPATALAESSPGLAQPGTDTLARDSWIVMLEGADDLDRVPRMARRAGGKAGLVYEHALVGFQFKGSARAAEALARNPHVTLVEADRPLHLTETVPFGVNRVSAWRSSGPADGAYQAGFRGAGARIAVLDTGIDLDHPDLMASIDTASGKNCLNTTLPPNDGHGHGTHVAGTAAAPLNAVGVVGVAPEAQLVAIKMFSDTGSSSVALSLCAIDHVTALNTDGNPANDIDVANMSWGEHRAWGDCVNDPLHRAICNGRAAGVVFVGGAGNDARDGGQFVPAAFWEVLSVSAISDFDGKKGRLGGCQFVPSLFFTECDDTLAFFSDWGPAVDLIAPGVNVYSTWAGGGYKVENGTSMATPHVTGVVALMRAANQSITPAQVRETIRNSGECPNGQWADADGTAGCAGQGTWPDDPDGNPEPLPNALRAAQAAAGIPPPPPPPPPPPDPTAPAAATLLNANGGAASISLTWTTPANGGSAITGYEVWRGTASGEEISLTTVGVQNSYEDAAVVSGTTYYYQVAAINLVGTGPRSNELSAALIEPASAPTLLGAPANGMVILSWTEPEDDGGSPVSGYNLYKRAGSGPEAPVASTGSGETTYMDTAVTNGTEYTYRVTAENAAGESASSNAVSVTPNPPVVITAPGPPQSLVVVKAKGSSSALVLTWSAPQADGGSPIASYFVYRRGPGESGFTAITLTNASTLTYTDPAVAGRSLYTYYVTAFNSYHQSARSNEVSIRTK